MSIQWSLVLFTAVAGMGAWLFACVALDEFKHLTKKTLVPATVIALILLVVGGCISITHLAHPERVLAALGHPTSGIFTEAALTGLCVACAGIYLILSWRNASTAARKVFAVIGIVLAIVFTFACGSSYMMSARESWNTVLLPLGYMGTVCPAGVGLYALICALRKEDEAAQRFAGTQILIAGIIALVLACAYGFFSGAELGATASLFWLAVVVCGGVVPIAMGLLIRSPKSSNKTMPYALIASCGGLIGCVAFRAIMWMIATSIWNFFEIAL